jgi:hypothetical protein
LHTTPDFGFSPACPEKVFYLYNLLDNLGFGHTLRYFGDSKLALADQRGLQGAGSWPVEPQVSFEAPYTLDPSWLLKGNL